MASKDLIESWIRTEAFLRAARSHLSKAAEGLCAGEIEEFNEYLEHNELGLALDTLEGVFSRSGLESWKVLEFMALAAASMGLVDQQLRYDEQLSKARGSKYETVLPT